MKRLIPVLTVIICLTACKKTKFDPEGPTDVRILNNTGQILEAVTVTTTDDSSYDERIFNYGTILPDSYSDYHRFDIAFIAADITLQIDGITYSTPATTFKYLTYIGQDRITYELTIDDAINHVLDINTIIEEPIDDL